MSGRLILVYLPRDQHVPALAPERILLVQPGTRQYPPNAAVDGAAPAAPRRHRQPRPQSPRMASDPRDDPVVEPQSRCAPSQWLVDAPP